MSENENSCQEKLSKNNSFNGAVRRCRERLGELDGEINADVGNLAKQIEKTEDSVEKKTAFEKIVEILKKTFGIDRLRSMKTFFDTMHANSETAMAQFLGEPENGIFTVKNLHESIKNSVGLGNILPHSQTFVKVNGVLGRRGYSKLKNKVGYFDKNGNYLKIFNDYKVELVDSVDFDISKWGDGIQILEKNDDAEKLESEADLYRKAADVFEQFEEKTPDEIATDLQTKTFGEIWEIRRAVGAKNFKDFLIERKVYNQRISKKDIYKKVSSELENSKLFSVLGSFEDRAELISALIFHESDGGRIFAVSPSGCLGLGQFTAKNYLKYGLNPFNPDESIKYVVRHLEEKSKFFGNDLESIKKTVVAYNRGEGFVLDAIRSAKNAGRDAQWYERLSESGIAIQKGATGENYSSEYIKEGAEYWGSVNAKKSEFENL